LATQVLSYTFNLNARSAQTKSSILFKLHFFILKPALEKFYFDESKYDTYLEQLNIEYPTVK